MVRHPTILHPSDFSPGSERAFAHALALAVVHQARLILLHAGLDAWVGNAPSVRQTLARWGYLEDGAPRTAVYDELKVRVEKVESRDRDPVRATLGHLRRQPAHLLVLATGRPHVRPRWLRRSVAETLARRTGVPTLFVPEQARGFIHPADGRSRLRRVLVPFGDDPRPDDAFSTAAEMIRLASTSRLTVTTLRVGDDAAAPPGSRRAGVDWESRRVAGPSVVDGILETARSLDSDLIVMATRWRSGRAGRRPSRTERVVRAAPCPVLALPARTR